MDELFRMPKSRFLMVILLVLSYQKPIFVTSEEVCHTLNTEQQCPNDTCCRESKCKAEGGEYRCCADPEEAAECSNCPACGKFSVFPLC